jgi:hypothetical protein
MYVMIQRHQNVTLISFPGNIDQQQANPQVTAGGL